MENLADSLLNKLAQNPRVRISNKVAVRDKLQGIIHAGFEKLLVITDFDFTLSNYTKNGARAVTTHGIFECNPHPEIYGYGKELQEKLVSKRDHFLRIEFCPAMSDEEKIPHMLEWWGTGQQLIVEQKFTRDTIRKIALDSGIELRTHAETFLRRVASVNVPLILFSAGIGNVIEFLLQDRMNNNIPDSLHIVSNMIKFDENDVCVAYTDPIIHTFNKNSSVIPHDAPFYADIEGRTSVILLGDSLGDVHMDIGIVKESVVLKIGFLNFNANTLIDRYLIEYDVVIIEDQTFDVPIALLDAIAVEIKHDAEELEHKSVDDKPEPTRAAEKAVA